MRRLFQIIALGILVLVVCIELLWIVQTKQSDLMAYRKKTIDIRALHQLRAQWIKQLSIQDPKAVYADIKRAFAQYPEENAHTVLHVFGEVLYDTFGEKGLDYCDETFKYGCYHGYMVNAIAHEGSDIAKTLYQRCMDIENGKFKYGCRHGIGHGIGDYYGPDNLVQSLELCSDMGWSGTVGWGCPGGVFMEYNFPRWDRVEQNRTSRVLDPVYPYYPCAEIPEKYQAACYFRLTELWEWSYDRDYTRIAQLCAGIADTKHQSACYIGAGVLTASSSTYNQDIAWDDCNKMPHDDARMQCIAGASYIFFMGGIYSEPDRWCLRAPEAFQAGCRDIVKQLDRENNQ